jgi:sigma-B regulation protein RsbU (phosphoserine phosphatase)
MRLGMFNVPGFKSSSPAQLVLVDTSLQTLTFASAGHCPALVAESNALSGGSSNSPRMRTVAPEGFPLGVVSSPEYLQEVVPLLPSSCVLLYTDGLTEAAGGDGTFFGEQRLSNCLERNFGQSASRVAAKIMGELEQFQSPAPWRDDLTLLILAGESAGCNEFEFSSPEPAAVAPTALGA